MKPNSFVAFVSTITLILSCGHDETPVPDRYVDFTINIQNAEYKNLQNPGGWVYVSGGFNGIFIYNFDNKTYYAFDRCCPQNIYHAPLIYDEKKHELYHTDTVSNCNSRFTVLLRGAVTYGESAYPLKRYEAILSGSRLRIVNE